MGHRVCPVLATIVTIVITPPHPPPPHLARGAETEHRPGRMHRGTPGEAVGVSHRPRGELR